MTLCIVERGMAGFERGRNLNKMGLKAQDTAELFFSQVKIPKENILGEPGKGFFYLMQGLAEERLLAAVGSIANARRAFDLTRSFAMERKVFGKPLAAKQNTRFKLAEMDTEISILEMFVDQLVALHNAGDLSINLAAKAKLQTTEVEWRMLDLGVQLHGGAGYMSEYAVERFYRDVRLFRIYEGTSQIQQLVIARNMIKAAGG